MQTIEGVTVGARVSVLTATGDRVPRRALTGVQQGHSFSVVWACREDEWAAAEAEGREPVGVPWPAEDVEPLDA
jgi:hypothetical protein